MKREGSLISDKLSIAFIFNKYFVNIARDIKEPESNSEGNFGNHPSISMTSTILSKNGNLNFDFKPTNPITIESCLLEMKVCKSCVYDDITPRLLKDSAPVVSDCLSTIFNAAISQGRYPHSWKKGQVTPLFKKDDEFSKLNYRSISILSLINNVFEKLLCKQLNFILTTSLMTNFLPTMGTTVVRQHCSG